MSNINVTPLQGQIGDTITVDGIGFIASHTITLTFGSAAQTSPTADTNGNWSQSFTVPTGYYGLVKITAVDGTNTQTVQFNVLSEDEQPEYCTPTDISEWLGIDITATSKPNKTQISKWIVRNQASIDYDTGHSWLVNGRTYIHDQSNVFNGIYDYGRGMPIYLKHRFVRPFDTTKGDTVEIWNGNTWQVQTIDNNNFIYTDESRGIMYIKGYLYTILMANRFRITYRYGGNNEGALPCPGDITKACILMTSIDILSRDFAFTQIKYGGEGNINKEQVMKRWQDTIDKTIQKHSEIQTVMA